MIQIINNTPDEELELLICALGYEDRSSFIAKSGKINYKNGLVFSFSDRNELSFNDNLQNFNDKKFKINKWDDFSEEGFISYLNKIESKEVMKIGIDISSMTRTMVAKIIYILSNKLNTLKKDFKVKMLYAPAEYTKPSNDLGTIEFCGPVIDEYARCSLHLNKPLYCLIGLGYEYGRAIGAIELLDVSETWVFKPIGKEKRYLKDVEKINQNLLLSLNDSNIIDYKIFDPYDLFYKMRSLVDGLLDESRLVIVPFGPKIYNMISILITELYENDISVWRVSPGQLEKPVQHKASGDIVEFSFLITYL